jgi:hypothetical protein
MAGGPGTVGTIASINGSTLTITTPSGSSVKVVTSASTTVTRASSGVVSDIRQGDRVVVAGSASGSTIAAERITDSGSTATNPPAGPRGGNPRLAAGTVSSINGSTLTITESDGTKVTVTTTGGTAVTTASSASVSDLAAGQTVEVSGTTASDGTVTATAIREGAVFRPGGFGER